MLTCILGLAKVAVGTKLDGSFHGIDEADKKYKHTDFNRGEAGLIKWNEDFQ